MRLNKYLAECGVCSRRKAEEIIAAGRVSVNGRKAAELGTEVREGTDVVFLDGKKIVPVTHYEYLMFNKPKGCVTTRSDEKGRKTVFDYIGTERRLVPVGRLDYDSEGLLLFTDDGDLTYRLTHPSAAVPKTYIVKIEGEIAESDLAILRKGATYEGVKFSRCKVKLLGEENGLSRLEVVITEGKNREIRKMFAAVEKNVVFLKRTAIGDLRLGGLGRGCSRELNEYEIAYLKSL
ncbi:MAG: pseudouridine synthase [Christensenellales bacterium]|nr:pseudouridine synthase [Christensenellales bacterium]